MHYASILLIPFGISIYVLYVILVKKLITCRKVGDKSVSSNASTVARASIQQRRVMVHAGVVTLIYVACIYPPCIANIVIATVFHHLALLAKVQCALDPLVYLFIHHFRR